MVNAGEKIMEAIRRTAKDKRIPCVVQGEPSMFQVVFMPGRIDAEKLPRSAEGPTTCRVTTTFRQKLLERGIHANSSGMACWFVSTAHTDEDVRPDRSRRSRNPCKVCPL